MHPAVGAGAHQRLQESPYIFCRTIQSGDSSDKVIVALDQPAGEKSIPVFSVFADGTELIDGYSGVRTTVREGRVTVTTPYTIVLLGTHR